MGRIEWSGRVVPFPQDVAAAYRTEGLWGTLPIAAEFRAVAEKHAARNAVVTSDGRLTYAELDEWSDQVAAGMVELGLEPGDRVLFQVTNRLLTVVAWYGVLKAGLIPVCTLAVHRAHEIGTIAERTGAVAHLVESGTRGFDLVAFAEEQRAEHPRLRHLLTIGASPESTGTRIEDLGQHLHPDDAREIVDAIQAEIDPDDVAVFQLSGGTTGVPKVIPRLHAEYWYNARAYAEAWGWDETTRNGHLIPLIHNAGIVCGLHGPHSVGGSLILATPDLSEALPLLAASRVTDVLLGHGHYNAVRLPEFDQLAASLRTVVLSGAKVPLPLFERLEELGVWSGQLFGMGEGFFAVTPLDAPREARLTTVGAGLSPADAFEVLTPGTEEPVADGEVGELCCAGPYTLRGYFDAADHNRGAFTSTGLYRTGDLVSVQTFGADRFLSVEGRLKDVINRGGEKINAEEVEVLLLRHPDIINAAVVAMPDERLGERSCAYLVGRGDPLSLPDVQRHLEGLGVAKFKWPERLEWIDEMPKTAVGKIDKKRLHAQIATRVEDERRALA
ncbi:2,3-dihydroxybenzoate-AMP ligase [Nocardioides luteus]|uniref:2,3-dihydroxybenzoate-AMP ligase n=1 Tax=Nocardioides luteus TaxID=1844 RepID=A0ABQ5SR37_9ACTN|nr:AMP-binding protein [Nocardioides luteus]MDR7313059.1 2,3-dihydroxybenzoate-AMP ligase [Nocardioides luteus]GGR44406.1 2,3-dihydroxybenzoate-AMP ligase [Nocardioides luteus]GLJ66120.1 2,3-dihydroxybenzoate-AMP ligase [Nocardioides luteus]